MTERQKSDLESLSRFFEVLLKSGDQELIILKLHLLIEEVLTKIICNAAHNKKYVYEAKLTFNQKCKMVRSLNDFQHCSWIWRALQLLNQARNELSHNLTSEELNRKLEDFISLVRLQNPNLFNSTPNEKFTDFHLAAYATYVPLVSHANFDPTRVRVSTIISD